MLEEALPEEPPAGEDAKDPPAHTADGAEEGGAESKEKSEGE